MTIADPATKAPRSRRRLSAQKRLNVERLVDLFFGRLRYDHVTPEARQATIDAFRRYDEHALAALQKEIEEQPLFRFPLAHAQQTADEAEAEAILARVSEELTIEEELTRQLMARQGL